MKACFSFYLIIKFKKLFKKKKIHSILQIIIPTYCQFFIIMTDCTFIVKATN